MSKALFLVFTALIAVAQGKFNFLLPWIALLCFLTLHLFIHSAGSRHLQQDIYGGGGGGSVSGGMMTGGGGGGTTTTSPSPSPSGSACLQVKPWSLGNTYSPLSASAGSCITFTIPSGSVPHGLYKIPDGNCPSTFQNGLNGQVLLQEPSTSGATVTYNFTSNDAGSTVWFACPVDSHCQSGMLQKVTVS